MICRKDEKFLRRFDSCDLGLKGRKKYSWVNPYYKSETYVAKRDVAKNTGMNLNSLILTTLALAIQANAYSKRVDVYGSCEGDKYSIKMHYHRPPTMTSQDQEVLNKCNNDSPGLHGWECELSCGKGPELCEEIYEMVEKKVIVRQSHQKGLPCT